MGCCLFSKRLSDREERKSEVRDLFVQERKTRGGGGILSSGTDLLGR